MIKTKADLSGRLMALAAAVSVMALAGVAASAQPAPTSAAEVDTTQWRQVDGENLFVFETTKGRIVIEAFPDFAPNHVIQFRTIIRSGDFDGTVFHRVIDDFMAQGGDISAAKGRPSGLPDLEGEFFIRRDPVAMPSVLIGMQESGRQGYILGAPVNTQSEFLAEMNETGTVETYIMHCPGVVSTARTDDPNSANSQFFMMRETSDALDRNYTAWGRVVEGLDVVRAIKAGPSSRNGAVEQPDVLVSAKVAADLEGEEALTAFVMRTDLPEFVAQIAGVDGRTNVCDLEPVPAIVVTGGE